MERLKPFWFYHIAVYLTNLKELPADATTTSGKGAADWARVALRTIAEVPIVPMPQAQGLAKKLQEEVELTFSVPDRKIPGEVRTGLIRKIEHLQSTMQAEVADADVFRVTPKGIFDIARIVTRAEDNLSSLARTTATPEVLADIRASGLCLAFEAFTASAFHGLRAVESAARRYRTLMSERSRDKPTLGEILNDLESRHSESAEKPRERDHTLGSVIGMLRMVKDVRDRIMHPELVLDEERALSMFKVICSAIDTMEQHRYDLTRPTGA